MYRHHVAAVVIGATCLWLACERNGMNSATADQPSAGRTSLGASHDGSSPRLAERFDDAPHRISTSDEGIFSDLDDRVRVHLPPRFDRAAAVGLREKGSAQTFAFVNGTSHGVLPEGYEPTVEIRDWGPADIDDDGIPNQLDILLGAKKAALNGADYQGGYEAMEYPGGDVPRSRGVCTDVVVRTLRNAGIDLQKRLHEDIVAHPDAYPMVDTPDPNIDQRRVRTLLPYFQRHWESLSTEPGDDEAARWLPGDIVFMDTMDDERPDHVGIVAARRGESGRPAIINNWTNGYETSPLDLLPSVPVTHRFRLAAEGPPIPARHRGLSGLLRRRGLDIPEETTQIVAVTTDGWNRPVGVLRRYERRGANWSRVGPTVRVRLGRAGLGWGRGLHDTPAPDDRRAPTKTEGDLRAPAGVFELGPAFGPTSNRPQPTDWPWRTADADDYLVDDPDSEHYNQWVDHDDSIDEDWNSAEHLSNYHLGILVRHNRSPVVSGAGSAIFMHTYRDGASSTLGCTSMREGHLEDLLGWLDPNAAPVLVQIPGWITE